MVLLIFVYFPYLQFWIVNIVLLCMWEMWFLETLSYWKKMFPRKITCFPLSFTSVTSPWASWLVHSFPLLDQLPSWQGPQGALIISKDGEYYSLCEFKKFVLIIFYLLYATYVCMMTSSFYSLKGRKIMKRTHPHALSRWTLEICCLSLSIIWI